MTRFRDLVNEVEAAVDDPRRLRQLAVEIRAAQDLDDGERDSLDIRISTYLGDYGRELEGMDADELWRLHAAGEPAAALELERRMLLDPPATTD